MVCVVAAAAVAFLATLYSRAAQRRKEAEAQLMYVFVEKIIGTTRTIDLVDCFPADYNTYLLCEQVNELCFCVSI